MKHISLSLLLFVTISASSSQDRMQYEPAIIPKNMTVDTKKKRFISLVYPAVKKVHDELIAEYNSVLDDINKNKNQNKIKVLKERYKIKSNEELLQIMKPHPKSIVLAQAAMESAWATSRFFREANNIFGVWSFNKNEPRIAAGEKRAGTKTIWLRKFGTLEDSVRKYYQLMATGHAYKELRELRVKTDDVHELVKKLDRYSEMGELYGDELSKVIRYNKFTKYD